MNTYNICLALTTEVMMSICSNQCIKILSFEIIYIHYFAKQRKGCLLKNLLK